MKNNDFINSNFDRILDGLLAICLACVTLLDPTTNLPWIAILIITILFLLTVYIFYLYSTKGRRTRSAKRGRKPIFFIVAIIIVLVCCLFRYCSRAEPPITETVPEIIQTDDDFISNAEVGSKFLYGSYWQQEFPCEKEPILWRVLAKEEDKILVISEYCLDCQPFFDKSTLEYYQSLEDSKPQQPPIYYYTWENSSLRTWLNNTFLNEAFSADEQARILKEEIPAHANPDSPSDITPGTVTEDKVFLLSIDEANIYFDEKIHRQAFPTEFAKSHGAGGDGNLKVDPSTLPDTVVNQPCWWWLRTPGEERTRIVTIMSGGKINSTGRYVSNVNFSVRPAMWLKRHK